MRAALVCALLVGLGLAASCKEDAKPEPPLSGSDSPMVVVTKSEITFEGKRVPGTGARAHVPAARVHAPDVAPFLEQQLGSGYTCLAQSDKSLECEPRDPLIALTKPDVPMSEVHIANAPPTCGVVIEHLNTALFTYEPTYMALAGTYATRVLASCHADAWPDDLKRCIVEKSPQALLDHACDALVTDELADKIIARVVPGSGLRRADLLAR